MSRSKSKFLPIDAQLSEITRGVEEILLWDDLKKKLSQSQKTNRALIIKCGFDPSAPDLHLGHTVLLQKMRVFQQLGHEVVFLIGDFTGMIGDPSGRSKQRKALTKKEIKKNAQTYEDQVFKILDSKKTRVEFNSKWMEKMSAAQMIELSTHYTVARMLERDDFQKRYHSNEPISIREFLYPIAQGYDSVALKADVELGGTDQKFNLLVGREIQRAYGQEPQVIMTLPLLEGTDGALKMSKSFGNYIGITESSKEMFGKLMSISDELMLRYYELLSDLSAEDFKELKKNLQNGKVHPRDAKVGLAHEIVKKYHGGAAAKEAEENFRKQFRERKIPEDLKKIKPPKSELPLGVYLREVGLVKSSTEASRLCKQRAVRLIPKGEISGKAQPLTNPNQPAKFSPGDILNIGKRIWAEIMK